MNTIPTAHPYPGLPPCPYCKQVWHAKSCPVTGPGPAASLSPLCGAQHADSGAPATDSEAAIDDFERTMTALGYPDEMFNGFYAEGKLTFYDKSANCMLDAWKAALAAQPQGAQAEQLRAALEPFANLASYRDVLAKFAECLRPRERESMVEAFTNAHRLFEGTAIAAKAEAPAPRTELSKRIREAATADVTEKQARLLIGAAEEVERAQQAAAPGARQAELVALLSEGVDMVAALADAHNAHDAETVRWLGAAGTLVETLRHAPSAPGTPEAPAGLQRPFSEVSSAELQLELHLRRGPNYQCQHQSCRSMEDGPGKFDTCPACGRKGYLGGGFVEDHDSAEWKAWEQRTVNRYRAAQLDGGQGEG